MAVIQVNYIITIEEQIAGIHGGCRKVAGNKNSGHLLRSPSPIPVNIISNSDPVNLYFLALLVYLHDYCRPTIPCPLPANSGRPPHFPATADLHQIQIFYVNRSPMPRSILCPSRFVQKLSPGPSPATRRFPARASSLPPSLPSSLTISFVSLPPPTPSPPLRSVPTAACHRRL